MDRIRITFFERKSGARKDELDVSVEGLTRIIGSARAETKLELPWLKLARFGDLRTEKWSLRHDRNVLAICGIEADYDGVWLNGQPLDFDAALWLARRAGLFCIIYTSASHTIPEPKWRILCPLSAEIMSSDTGALRGARDKLMGRLAGVYGNVFDPGSWDLSRAYLFGATPAGAELHRVEAVGGRAIDLLDNLDATALGKPRASSPPPLGGGGGARPTGLGTSGLGAEASSASAFRPKLRIVLPTRVKTSVYRELDRIRFSPLGGGNKAVNLAAYKLAQIKELRPEEIESYLLRAALAIGLEQGNSRKTIRAAMERGARYTRTAVDVGEILKQSSVKRD